MVTTKELNSFIDSTFGSADSGVIAEYDVEGPAAAPTPGDPAPAPAAADGKLSVGDMTAGKEINLDTLADFVVTELVAAETELGTLAASQLDGDTLKNEIIDVFKAGGEAAAALDDGMLTGVELTSALKKVITVDDFAMVDQVEFDGATNPATKDGVEAGAGAAGDDMFDEAELTAYFDQLGVSTENAAIAASMLFAEPSMLTGTPPEITASDVLAFMNGSLNADEKSEDAATFETFNTAITDLLNGATAFDKAGDETIDDVDLENLAGAKDSDLNQTHLIKILEKMGATAAQAEPLANHILQYGQAEGAAVGGNFETISSSDVATYVDSFGDKNGKIGQYAFDAFVAHAEGVKNGDTPYIDVGNGETFTDIPASTMVANEAALFTTLTDNGVGHQDAQTIAEKMTAAGLFDTGDVDLNALIMNDTNTAIDITSLNTFVDEALNGDGSIFETLSYENGFSLGMFNTAADVSDLGATGTTIDEAKFGANVTTGLTSPYNSADVATILENLGIDPEIAPSIADYLIEQYGAESNAIAADQIFSILANIDDEGADGGNDTVIDSADMTQLITNFEDNVQMNEPIENTENIDGEAFGAVASLEGDLTTINLTEFTAGETPSATLDEAGIIALMESIGVETGKAEMIAEQALITTAEDTMSYADLFAFLTDGEDELSITGLQTYIDTIEETRGLPTVSQLEADAAFEPGGDTGFVGGEGNIIATEATAIAEHIVDTYTDPGAFEPEVDILAQLITQKKANLEDAGIEGFSLSEFHSVLVDYAEGTYSLDGSTAVGDGDGTSVETAYVIGSELGDITGNELTDLGVADGDFIRLQTNGENSGTLYQVTIAEDGAYTLTEVDETGTEVQDGETRTIPAGDAVGTGAGSSTAEDPVAIGADWIVDITIDQITGAASDTGIDLENGGVLHVTVDKADDVYTIKKTNNGNDTYVIEKNGQPARVVTTDTLKSIDNNVNNSVYQGSGSNNGKTYYKDDNGDPHEVNTETGQMDGAFSADSGAVGDGDFAAVASAGNDGDNASVSEADIIAYIASLADGSNGFAGINNETTPILDEGRLKALIGALGGDANKASDILGTEGSISVSALITAVGGSGATTFDEIEWDSYIADPASVAADEGGDGTRAEPYPLTGTLDAVKTSDLYPLFEDGSATIWVTVDGKDYQVAKNNTASDDDNNYSFFEGGGLPANGDVPDHVIQKDGSSIPDLNGPNPTDKNQIFRAQGGELVYHAADGNIYALTGSGPGYTVGDTPLSISGNGTVLTTDTGGGTGTGSDPYKLDDNYATPNDIPKEDLAELFAADGDGEIFVQINVNNTFKVEERGNAYIFSYANNGSTEKFAIPKEGVTPPLLESDDVSDHHDNIVTAESGESLYITNTGEAYVLDADGKFNTDGSSTVTLNEDGIVIIDDTLTGDGTSEASAFELDVSITALVDDPDYISQLFAATDEEFIWITDSLGNAYQVQDNETATGGQSNYAFYLDGYDENNRLPEYVSIVSSHDGEAAIADNDPYHYQHQTISYNGDKYFVLAGRDTAYKVNADGSVDENITLNL